MAFDHCSTHMNIRDLREAFRAITPLANLRRFYSQENIQFSDVNCCFFIRLHLSTGCYDCRRTPGSRHSLQFGRIQILFLLFMSIDAPECTTNSLSSCKIWNCEGRQHFSVGERNAALCFSCYFRIFFASFHAASRAQCSCHYVSSLKPILKFRSVGATLMSISMTNSVQRRILISKLGIAQ